MKGAEGYETNFSLIATVSVGAVDDMNHDTFRDDYFVFDYLYTED